MKHAKSAGFFESIVEVKEYLRGFQSVHVSFQSTPSCNITSVDARNECTNFVEIREKCIGKHKHHWVIEMNHVWRIYLAMYFWIDVLDGRIQNSHIFYRVWKYWNSPMNYCLDITIASVYNIYLESWEGLLFTLWKV